MACRKGRELEALASGQLPRLRRERLESHLQGCAACRSELARWQRLQGWLGALPVAEPPSDLLTRTLQRARRELAAPQRLAVRRPAAWAWAAPALAAAGVLWLVMSLHQPAPLAPSMPTPAVVAAAPTVHSPAPAVAPVISQAPAPVSAGQAVASAPANATRLSAAPARRLSSPVAVAVTPPAPQPAPAVAPSPTRAVAQAAVVSRALRQAAAHEASGDTDLEIAALENIAVAYPGSPDAARALLNAAALEAARGNYAEASGAYQRVLALPGRGHLPQALAYKGLGDLRRREVGSDEIVRHNYGQAERILRETARKAQGATRSEALVALGEVRRAASYDDEILAAGVTVPAVASGSETLERTSDIL